MGLCGSLPPFGQRTNIHTCPVEGPDWPGVACRSHAASDRHLPWRRKPREHRDVQFPRKLRSDPTRRDSVCRDRRALVGQPNAALQHTAGCHARDARGSGRSGDPRLAAPYFRRRNSSGPGAHVRRSIAHAAAKAPVADCGLRPICQIERLSVSAVGRRRRRDYLPTAERPRSRSRRRWSKASVEATGTVRRRATSDLGDPIGIRIESSQRRCHAATRTTRSVAAVSPLHALAGMGLESIRMGSGWLASACSVVARGDLQRGLFGPFCAALRHRTAFPALGTRYPLLDRRPR